MEVTQRSNQNISNVLQPFLWTRKALNYRIPRRGANYMLFSIVVDSLCALIAPVLLGLSFTELVATMNMPVWLFLSTIIFIRIATFNTLNIYTSSEQPRFISEVGSVVFAFLVSIMVLLGTFYLTQTAVSLVWIGGVIGISLGAHLGWRTVAYVWSYYQTIRRILLPRRVLIIGGTKLGCEIADIISRFPLPTTRVVGFLDNNLSETLNDVPIIGRLDTDIFKVIKDYDIDEIILTTTSHVERGNSSAILNLPYVPVPVRLVPNYLKLNLYSANADSLNELPLVDLRQPAIPGHQRVIKRAFDIVVATIGLIATLPFFSLVALMIWLNDRGPIFFKQERYGENGKIFHILKFRSMVVDAHKMVDSVKITDASGQTIYKRENDPRVTTIGKFIRKTSLDELPQLLNILRGDMSIVGPRPEVRRIVEEQYEPWQFERMRVPQGLTGWWQVTSRSEKECYTDTGKDIYYIKNYSLALDIKIILMTIPALLRGKGAF